MSSICVSSSNYSLIYSPIFNKGFLLFLYPTKTGGRSYVERVAGTFLCPEIIELGIQLFGCVGKAIEIVGYFQWSFPHPLTILILLGNLN